MDNTSKLIDDVKVALRAAGFANVTSRTTDLGTLLSAENGKTGAMFQLTTDTSKKATAAPVTSGARAPETEKLDVVVTPAVPNAAEMIKADPDLAAQWLGISKETALSLIKPAAR